MDSTKLSSDQVGQMLKHLPTTDELSLLTSIPEQDKSNLGKSELYPLSLSLPLSSLCSAPLSPLSHFAK